MVFKLAFISIAMFGGLIAELSLWIYIHVASLASLSFLFSFHSRFVRSFTEASLLTIVDYLFIESTQP